MPSWTTTKSKSNEAGGNESVFASGVHSWSLVLRGGVIASFFFATSKFQLRLSQYVLYDKFFQLGLSKWPNGHSEWQAMHRPG